MKHFPALYSLQKEFLDAGWPTNLVFGGKHESLDYQAPDGNDLYYKRWLGEFATD